MAINLNGFVTWLKGWFYTKEEVNTIANSKLNANLTTANKNVVTNGSGDVVLEDKPVIPDVSGFINTAGTGLSKSGTTLNHSNSITAQTSIVFKKIKYDGQGHITGTADVGANDLPEHSHSATKVIDQNSNNYSNIGITTSWAEQGAINSAINTTIGNLQSIKAIEVTSNKGTASSDKLGKLFIVNENNKVNVYYVKQNGTGSSATYTWEKMDANILDELVVNWSDVQGRPTKTSDFTNDGADGTNVFVANNDSRLTNARTPTSHASSATTYGVGTTSNYGHNKIRDNLTASTLTDGESLSAHQGYVLNQAKQDKITSIALVSKNTDENGKIIFYTGDEPT